MKKWLAALGLCIATPVMADGFYVGGQLGYANVNAEASGIDLGSSDIAFIVSGGYQYSLNELFVAAEVDGLWGRVETNKTVNSIQYQSKRNNIYGIHGLAGMTLAPDADVYVRLGLARAKFEVKEGAASGDKTANGTVFGAGARYHFDEMLALRLDYRYVKYSDFKYADGGADVKAKEHIFSLGLQHTF